MRAVRPVFAILLLAAWMPASGAESRQACSGSGFLASDYSWFGIPVMHNARQSVGDDERCLYVVPVSVAVAEEWHGKKLAEEGWLSTRREPTERGVSLEFRDSNRLLRIDISDIQFATAILLRRPVFVPAEASRGRLQDQLRNLRATR